MRCLSGCHLSINELSRTDPIYFELIKTAFEIWNLQFNKAGFNAHGCKVGREILDEKLR